MVALVALAALATLAPARSAPRPIDAARLSGDRVAVEEVLPAPAHGRTFQAATMIAAPVDKLCAIIQDYPRYPAFMPNVARATVIGRAPEGATVDLAFDLPLGQHKRYRLLLTPAVAPGACRLSWKMLPLTGVDPADTIAATTGAWQLASQPGNPAATRVDYLVYTDPGPVPFGFGAVVDAMSKRSLPATLDGLRRRAAQ
jgi:hypothetical protein